MLQSNVYANPLKSLKIHTESLALSKDITRVHTRIRCGLSISRSVWRQLHLHLRLSAPTHLIYWWREKHRKDLRKKTKRGRVAKGHQHLVLVNLTDVRTLKLSSHLRKNWEIALSFLWRNKRGVVFCQLYLTSSNASTFNLTAEKRMLFFFRTSN